MTQERWQRVEYLFNQAVALPPPERMAWLAGETGGDPELLAEVRALLESDQEAPGFVELQVQGGLLDFHEQQPAPVRMAGPYRLVRQLGQGGMGTVWLAERADGQYQGEVAIKLVRPGMDTEFFLTRFRRERQTLARLRHPHIARLLDSGTTADGLPYIVMERVDGCPVNQFCRDQKLSVEDTLSLFLRICEAVAYAHHNFVVHRDLKPGNILVESDGTPKLLDFGICKLLFSEAPGDATVEAGQMMTPDYASPEQVRGEPITISSDVYSLAAVLYELLTAKRPHLIEKYTPQAVERAVCEQPVRLPSTVVSDRALSRRLSGDLDNILIKAMQNEPNRRYQSVEQFAEDIRRVLNNEPVTARPETLFYLTGKFVRRNRGAKSAAGLVILCLVAGLVAYAREASLAKSRFADARKLANAMIFDIYEKVRDLPGSLQARQAIVHAGIEYLDRMAIRAPGDASLRHDLAGAYLRMGEVQGNVLGSHTGDTSGALVSFRKGISLLTPEAGDRPADLELMVLHQRMGDVFSNSVGDRQALSQYDQAIAIGTRLLDANPGDDAVQTRLASTYIAASRLFRTSEDRPRALEYAHKAAGLDRERLARHPDSRPIRADLALAIASAGTAQAGLNQIPAARAKFEEAISLWEEICRAEPANVAYQRSRMLAYSHLGDVLGNPNYPNLGDTAGAQSAFRSMLAIAEQNYRRSTGDQGAIIDFGMALMRVAALPLEQETKRVEMYHQAEELLGQALRRNPANANVRMNLAALNEQLGDLLQTMGKPALAAEEYRHALEFAERILELRLAAQRIAVTVSRKLAEDAVRRGRPVAALEYARHGFPIPQKYSAPAPAVPPRVLLASACAALGDIYRQLDQPVQAAQWWQRSVDEFHKVQNEPGFTKAHRREMESVIAALGSRRERQTR